METSSNVIRYSAALVPYLLGIDPEYISNDPYSFVSDRWSNGSIAARKGTKSDDHGSSKDGRSIDECSIIIIKKQTKF